MSLLKTLRKVKHLTSNYKNVSPVSAHIDIEDDTVNFTINGIPSSIDIQYEGAVFFDNKLPIIIKSFVTKNRILITNIFKAEIPELLYNFQGKLKIISCKIMTYEGNIFLATINNNANKLFLNTQETNFEDDSIILQEEYEEPSAFIRRGQISRSIKPNAINEKGNLIIPPKDIDFIAETIYKSSVKKGVKTPQKKIKQKPTKVIVKPTKVTPIIVQDKKGKY